MMLPVSRRRLLKSLLYGAGVLALPAAAGRGLAAAADRLSLVGFLSAAQDILAEDGFSARVVASSGTVVGRSGYVWHGSPDGGGCLAHPEGGWLYVSNSEQSHNRGGVGVLRFDAEGNVSDAYPILEDTNRNCGGGITPWGTWLSCEETQRGSVWECDPLGRERAQPLPALGLFSHESAAVDPVTMQVYLSEDERDGRLYRYTPARRTAGGRPDLRDGVLEVAKMVEKGRPMIAWEAVDDPLARAVPLRYQVSEGTPFRGAEGVCYHRGAIYFATKGDDRVWRYDTRSAEVSVFYDAAAHARPLLTGVDTLVMSPHGDLVVSEDGGDMQLVAIRPDGSLYPIVQIRNHDHSEVTGPAFSPDGTRLYFSSQRGRSGHGSGGITYELSGPFAALSQR